MGLKAIVFDFDGTLAELRLDFSLMRERVLDLALSFGLASKEDGSLPALEMLYKLASDLPGPEETEFLKKGLGLVKEIELSSARNARLFDFTRPLLKELQGKGLSLGVITRSSKEAVEMVFPDMKLFLAAFVPREETEKVKPHPGHLLEALRRLDKTPTETLYVCDHPMDIETGKRAGAKTCGVLTGKSTKESLLALAPDYLFADCLGILGLFRDN